MKNTQRKISDLIPSIIALVLLYFTSLYSYILFHTLAEIFSIVIAFTVFIIAWNSREYIQNSYILFIGLAYLFIAFLDLLHTLGYTGMAIFPEYPYLGNQIWVGARYMESLTLLSGFLLFKERKSFKPWVMLFIYTLSTLLFLLSIFYWKVFPVCYVEGLGQTRFKIVSEYIIISILFVSLILLYRNRKRFSKKVFLLLIISIVFTILSELSFTLYISNYDFVNMLGHYFKIVSFYLIYIALVEKGIRMPYELIFHELSTGKKELEKANETKDKLFSILAHDLRGSVGNWANAIGLLEDDEIEESVKMEMVKELKKSARGINSLLENLLHWAGSRSDGIPYSPKPVYISEIIQQTLIPLHSAAKEKDITLSLESNGNPRVMADPDMLKFILRNLISNAIKFTPKGGSVAIACRTTEFEAEISVTDNGLGLSREEIDRIFSSSALIKTGTNREKGIGLGLKTSWDFIKKHGRDLKIESNPGQGSTFKFNLVLAGEE